METVRTIEETRREVRAAKADGKSVGFVPTMGALHEGHLSLMRAGRQETDFLVISVFVNPKQFNDPKDLKAYPRELKADAEKANGVGVDLIFAPSDAEMYPKGAVTFVDQHRLTERWEGAHRPGHFRGVLTVVAKLFNIIEPDIAYFGRKDFQQAAIIKTMAADLNMSVEIKVLPTVREPDGLAMSSRNVHLSEDERKQALCLFRALSRGREMVEAGERDTGKIVTEMKQFIDGNPLARIDYVAIADPDRLEKREQVEPGDVALVAVRIGKTRLIDNMILLKER
ncbi:MAG: pantoate--beta-alanine ligase [Planctomycetes bacterium]|nr:pantoate--beta-alanine ligase [Planctomycetota bacterium]